MIVSRRTSIQYLGAYFAGTYLPSFAAETDFVAYSDDDKEKFLRRATLLEVKDIGHGVTKPLRAELVLGEIKHSAQIQSVDKELPDFFGEDRKPVPMKDCWRFNVAAYKIDRLLGLKLGTVVVARPFKGRPAAFSWWVDDVLFEEVDRIKKGLTSPDPEGFERQRALSRVFDELVMNIDRNLANLLITKTWKIALIDHTRCFTPYHGIRNKENLTRCSRELLTRMKSLTAAAVTQAVGSHLTRAEVQALISRRDRIVEFFENRVREKGEENVLFS
jgi:hypothetical protein